MGNRQDSWQMAGVFHQRMAYEVSRMFDWLDIPSLIASAEFILEYPMVDRDPIVRMWPVDAVVGENGAFYFCYDHETRAFKWRFLMRRLV